jgi:hypothetical protein
MVNVKKSNKYTDFVHRLCEKLNGTTRAPKEQEGAGNSGFVFAGAFAADGVAWRGHHTGLHRQRGTMNTAQLNRHTANTVSSKHNQQQTQSDMPACCVATDRGNEAVQAVDMKGRLMVCLRPVVV